MVLGSALNVREAYRQSLLRAVVAGHKVQLREAEKFLKATGLEANGHAIEKISRQFTAGMNGDKQLNRELEVIFELPPSKANASLYLRKLLDGLEVHLWQAIAAVAGVHD
jgi:hypothetical protein